MKKKLILVLFSALTLALSAQDSHTAYSVLKLPVSAHVAALGGENNSVTDDDPGVAQHNPALLADITPNQLGLTFMTHAGGGTWAGAQYVKGFGLRHTATVFMHYFNYGEMTETDDQGRAIGAFSPKDIIAGVGYGYVLAEGWAGGANLKTIYSRMAEYSAAALAVDVGINYYNKEDKWSVSAMVRNAGAQFKSYDGRTEIVPYSLQMGFSKELMHTPLRFSLTLVDLTKWRRADYFQADEKRMSNARLLTNHLVVGVDWLPSRNVTLSAGYNFRRAYELTAAGRGHGAGFSLGAGFHFSRLRLDLAWVRYHLAVSSLMATLGYRL